MNPHLRTILALVFPLLFSGASAAEPSPKAPVPPSPYLSVVYRYADALLEHGRDQQGPVKTGLFLSAFNRKPLQPLTNITEAPSGLNGIPGQETRSQPHAGASPNHDQNLLRLLYTLSGLSGESKYRDAADNELKWCLEHDRAALAPSLGGRITEWNTVTDIHEPSHWTAHRPWMLWDRSFELVPDAATRLTIDLLQRDKVVDASREAGSFAGGLDEESGFFIRSCAIAYAHTGNTRLLDAIGKALDDRRRVNHLLTPPPRPSLAIDYDGAAHHVPSPLTERLRKVAAQDDAQFCKDHHDLAKRGGFSRWFIYTNRMTRTPPSPLWVAKQDTPTTAQIAMLCVARYQNTGNTAYRDLILQSARFYMNADPPLDEDLWPMTFGHVISLQLAAWRITADPVHLNRARYFADTAVKEFWQDNPLPRASLKTDHYESVTGSDTLALALLELHLDILAITAVRAPSNTIDR